MDGRTLFHKYKFLASTSIQFVRYTLSVYFLETAQLLLIINTKHLRLILLELN